MASRQPGSTAEETVSLFTHLQSEPPRLRINKEWCAEGENTKSRHYSHRDIRDPAVWKDFHLDKIRDHARTPLETAQIKPRPPSTTPRSIHSELEFAYVFFETVHPFVRRGLACGFDDLKSGDLLKKRGRTSVYLGTSSDVESEGSAIPDLLFWSGSNGQTLRRGRLPGDFKPSHKWS